MASERNGGASRHAWTAAGTILVGIGAVGLLVPVLPTTPFLLLAAGCYARGSPRAYRLLMDNPLFGSHLKSYHEGRGLTREAKVLSMAAVVAGISFSIIIIGVSPLPTIVMAVVAAAVIVHLMTLPTADGSES
jgi:uncharacterized protein